MNATQRNDGQLLAEFVQTGAPAPFEELFNRHAAAVLRTCQRAAGRVNDAEDVLQTVFVTLASKAHTLTDRACIAGWLYRVAWHAGTRHRRTAMTRRRHEYNVAAAAETTAESMAADPLLALETEYEMQRELANLPDEYADPIVLHHLLGMTIEQTADALGEKTGTVAARLSRGRDLMRERLERRHTILSAGSVVLLLGQNLRLPEKLADHGDMSVVIARSVAARSILTGGAPALATTGAMVIAGAALRFVATMGISMGVSTAAVAATSAMMPANSTASSSSSTSSSASAVTVPAAGDPLSSPNLLSSGGGAALPEPGSMVILAGGAMTLLLHRRRRV